MSRLMGKIEAARKKKTTESTPELTPEQQKFYNDNKQYITERWKKISPYMYLIKAYNKELNELGEMNDYGKSMFTGQEAYEKVGKYFIEFINSAKAIKMPEEQFNYPSDTFINKLRLFKTKTKPGSAGNFIKWLYDSLCKAEGDGVIQQYCSWYKFASANNERMKKEAQADLFLQQHLRTNMRRLAQRIA